MEVHTDLLSKGLAQKGHRVTIITTGHKEGKVSETIHGVAMYYLRAIMCSGTCPVPEAII